LRVGSERLDGLALAIADAAAGLRQRVARHRVAISFVGGGIAGAVFATRWRALWRFTAAVTGLIVRAAALSAISRAAANRSAAERACENHSI